jgi:hypothetical protein
MHTPQFSLVALQVGFSTDEVGVERNFDLAAHL